MKNRKTLRLIAGACFAILAILSIVSSAQRFDLVLLLTTILTIPLVLISVSMFTSNPILTTVGSVLELLICAFNLILYIVQRDHYVNFGRLLLSYIMDLIIWLLLLIASINTKSAKSMGIIAGVIATVKIVIRIYSFVFLEGYLAIATTGFWSEVVLIIGAVLVGLSLEGLATRKVAAVASGGKAKIQQGSDNTFERLTRLKALLDKGIITQEEFETKKKQILGK